MAKFKSYQRSVFSHRRALQSGIDNGRGDLYRGDTCEMTLNFSDDEGVLTQRDGMVKKASIDSALFSGKSTGSGLAITAGTDAYYGVDINSTL
jgi:hypothetical protein